jgi:hypothetical protein
MINFIFHENTISQKDIDEIFETLTNRNYFGGRIVQFCEEETFDVIFANEETMFKVNPKITDITHSRGLADENG